MADIYIDVGPMSVSKDAKKVATKYAKNAKKLMREAAIKAIRGAAGFTADKEGPGFHVDATLSEVSFGTLESRPAVTCKVIGILASYPQKKLIAQRLTGSATLGGSTSDGAVDECIGEAMDAAMTDAVIPALRKQPKP